jgi:hypothetical protein
LFGSHCHKAHQKDTFQSLFHLGFRMIVHTSN